MDNLFTVNDLTSSINSYEGFLNVQPENTKNFTDVNTDLVLGTNLERSSAPSDFTENIDDLKRQLQRVTNERERVANEVARVTNELAAEKRKSAEKSKRFLEMLRKLLKSHYTLAMDRVKLRAYLRKEIIFGPSARNTSILEPETTIRRPSCPPTSLSPQNDQASSSSYNDPLHLFDSDLYPPYSQI